MFESFKNIFEISEKKLKLGGLYSRQNVHESFKQKTKFTKGSGYWGISGIVKPDKKKGNFITNFINKKRDESPLGGNKRVDDTRQGSGDDTVGKKIKF